MESQIFGLMEEHFSMPQVPFIGLPFKAKLKAKLFAFFYHYKTTIINKADSNDDHHHISYKNNCS